MTKVGLPGAKEGWQASDPTIAALLKDKGYATGQFGKNHFGDRDEHLPTMHGFDEYFGSLYHLNASEEPENLDYPKDPEFLKKFGPRGVLQYQGRRQGRPDDRGHRPADQEAHGDHRRGNAGCGKGFHHAPEERRHAVLLLVERARACISARTSRRSTAASPARTSIRTAWSSTTPWSATCSSWSTISASPTTPSCMYSTDNGPHYNAWPDAGTTPFRSEKNSNWEGAYRVPAFVRWPGHFPAGADAQRPGGA